MLLLVLKLLLFCFGSFSVNIVLFFLNLAERQFEQQSPKIRKSERKRERFGGGFGLDEKISGHFKSHEAFQFSPRRHPKW